MKGMTIANIARACDGEYFGSRKLLETEISSVVTDSRQAAPGCLFAAIVGERVDGHDFISSAAAAGAVCCLCEKKPEGVALPAIVVDSTPAALVKLAAFYRSQFDIPIIGVTGSVGKTTAKEMIASVLSRKYNVLKTQGNFNNELGVPLTLFELRDEHQVAVVEMGISDFGEMRRLTQIARPDMAVFTVIGYSHLEFLKDREGVLREKAEMLEGMPLEGIVFINGDDDMLRSMDCPQEKISFGTDASCDVRAENIETLGLKGMSCHIVCGPRRIPVGIPAFGLHMVSAAAAGAAVGIRMGLTDEEIAAGIAAYKTVGSRSAAFDTGYTTIIDDCYNANPNSSASAIKSLATMEGRLVCILGDMLELGENSARLHYDLGALAAKCGVSLVITCGPEAENIYFGAREHGLTAKHYSNKGTLLEELPFLIMPGDTVLVKASRGMAFEDIVEALKKLK
ncbi:MAG TPA: UDP-N-acetylmuramoyl-tripeptide--D-alanyl-D-alanine ligase [Clostridiales bacterium]|nr:UDP-N-acetylmuramoyl-tripeptide--D-alanyl-D-alanine ligase [Clostridiales bacterium]